MRKFKTVMLTLLLVISTGVVVSTKEIDSSVDLKL